MFQKIYEWIRELSVYLVLATAVLHAVPGTEYKKYVRFFTGLLLVALALEPVFSLCGRENPVTNFYSGREYEKKLEEIEQAAGDLYGEDGPGQLEEIEKNAQESLKPEEAEDGRENSIHVEEVQID